MIVPMIDLGMSDAHKHLNRKKHTEYMTPTVSGICYAATRSTKENAGISSTCNSGMKRDMEMLVPAV